MTRDVDDATRRGVGGKCACEIGGSANEKKKKKNDERADYGVVPRVRERKDAAGAGSRQGETPQHL